MNIYSANLDSYFLNCIRCILQVSTYVLCFQRVFTIGTTLQVKVFAWLPFGNQLFWFWGDFFTKQVASSEILGAMVTKMVATWRVELV